MLLPFSSDITVLNLSFEFEVAKYQILSRSEITFLKDVFNKVQRRETTPATQHISVLVAKGGGIK